MDTIISFIVMQTFDLAPQLSTHPQKYHQNPTTLLYKHKHKHTVTANQLRRRKYACERQTRGGRLQQTILSQSENDGRITREEKDWPKPHSGILGTARQKQMLDKPLQTARYKQMCIHKYMRYMKLRVFSLERHFGNFVCANQTFRLYVRIQSCLSFNFKYILVFIDQDTYNRCIFF